MHRLLPIAIALLLIASCTSYKDIVYLQENEFDTTTSFANNIPVYRIQKRDILYIKIISMNREVTELINVTPSYSANMFTNDASFYIYGYNVNDSGNVEIPIIGNVNVAGKTLEEAKVAIRLQTLKTLKDPTIIVKLVSFKFSVLGEVNRTGTFVNYNNQLTVLEAISQAGDITNFGNRKRVKVIRCDTIGTRTIDLDLTDKSILQSEGFYLLPNDIVYVEPVKSRNFRNNIPTISLVMGALTTGILIWNTFKPVTSNK